MPRMPAAARETRDALILRLFLAGHSYRDIARNKVVNLSANGVHKIVKRELARGAQRRDVLAEQAFDVHLERLESLFAANYAMAVNTKAPNAERVRAGELCRRYLVDIERLQDVTGAHIGGGSAPPPNGLGGDDDDDDVEVTDLTEYRKRSGG